MIYFRGNYSIGVIVIRYSIFLMLTFLMASALPVTPVNGVEVLDSEGFMLEEAWNRAFETPFGCTWEKDENAGPDFHATNADGSGSICIHPWLAHCDGDSLVCHGSWALYDGGYCRSFQFRATLSCSVYLATATRLVADRTVIGNLSTDEHSLTIVFPSGTEEILLAPGTSPDQVTLELEPGLYQVTLSVDAIQGAPYGTPIYPYDGRVRLKWEDSQVAATTPSWGSLKSLFR